MAKPIKSSAAKPPRGKTGDPDIGQRMKDLRGKAGKTPKDLGISKSLLSQYENGTTMPTVSISLFSLAVACLALFVAARAAKII